MTRPVIIRGVSYPSMTAAGQALGVTKATVGIARRKGQSYLDRVGLGVAGYDAPAPLRAARASKAVTIGGVTYASNATAAAALGVRDTYISAWRKVEAAAART